MTRSNAFSKGPEASSHAPRVVLLAGPTAVGKTSLSLELAKRLSGEIVNADSMQVYRYMDIGTAKPSAAERSAIAHHLIDVADPDEPFDAAMYLDLARPVIDRIISRGNVPIVVGGTGLYMKVLTRGICSGPPADSRIKEELSREEESSGLGELYERLSRIDPDAASRIHPHDRQRIHRALEVFRLTGIPISSHQKSHGFEEAILPAVKVFVFREREELYTRINSRVEEMMARGFDGEVKRLLEMGYGPDLKPMQSLGYRQMALHLLGRLSREDALYQMKRETRRYAKRQLTWFRGDPEFRWFPVQDFESILEWIVAETQKDRMLRE